MDTLGDTLYKDAMGDTHTGTSQTSTQVPSAYKNTSTSHTKMRLHLVQHLIPTEGWSHDTPRERN